jgi:hypothetical protein
VQSNQRVNWWCALGSCLLILCLRWEDFHLLMPRHSKRHLVVHLPMLRLELPGLEAMLPLLARYYSAMAFSWPGSGSPLYPLFSFFLSMNQLNVRSYDDVLNELDHKGTSTFCMLARFLSYYHLGFGIWSCPKLHQTSSDLSKSSSVLKRKGSCWRRQCQSIKELWAESLFICFICIYFLPGYLILF